MDRNVEYHTRHKDIVWMVPKTESTWRDGLVVLKPDSTCLGMSSATKEISEVALLGWRRHHVLKPDSTCVGMSSTGNDVVEETYQ